MSKASEIKELIKKIAQKDNIFVFTAEIIKVDVIDCSIKYGGLTLTNVKNFCIDEKGSLQIIPKMGSMVTVVDFGGFRDMEIIKVQEIDKIIFNDGNNGGIVNIIDLTSKLNNLVTEIKALKTSLDTHIHAGVTVGAGVTGTSVISGSFSNFNKSDFEDTNITH